MFNREKNSFTFPEFSIQVIFEALFYFRLKYLTIQVLRKQILFTGYEALPLILFAGLSVSGLIIIQGSSIIPEFIQSPYFTTIFVSVIMRELGSLLTALIVIARSGTAVSTELGNMNINNETEAIISFGISPIAYLVVPRVLGMMLSLTTLSIYFTLAALFGGWLISQVVYPVNLIDYLADLFETIKVADLLVGFVKPLVFGYFIGIIACYHGLKVDTAITEVPQRAIKTVVYSVTALILLDIVISGFFYLFIYE